MNLRPDLLKAEAQEEIYKMLDSSFRKLPKNPDGSFNELAQGFQDNDIDALRHAYVSGVFAREYGEFAADMFGRLNEYFPFYGSSAANAAESINMDLWNNAIGRKCGKKSKTKEALFKCLLKALKNGELIITPSDSRQYTGAAIIRNVEPGMVIVLHESKDGKNLLFYDFYERLVLTKEEFVLRIGEGKYPHYTLKSFKGDIVPVSKRDSSSINNLG